MKKLIVIVVSIILSGIFTMARSEAAVEISSGIVMNKYVLNGTTITGIERGTSISSFMSNFTFTGGASGAVYGTDGITPKETGFIATDEILIILPTNTQYTLKLEDFIQEENFDSTSASNIAIHPTGFTKISHPADGETIPDSPTAVADDAGVNRGVISNKVTNAKVSANYTGAPLTGKICFEVDYWLEGPTALGSTRFIDIYGTNSVGGASTQIFALSNGSNNADNTYSLRPLYYDTVTGANKTVSLSTKYDYKKWYHAKIIVDTDQDTVTIYVNDALILSEGLKFYNNINATNIVSVYMWHSQTATYRFVVDNYSASYILPPKVISQVYTITGNNATGILEGTTADSVLGNISLIDGQTMQIYEIYLGPTDSGNVIRNEAVQDGDKLVAMTEDQKTATIYILDTCKEIEIHFYNTSNNKISHLSEITDGKLNITANIFNMGQFNHGENNFVLLVCSYMGNELMKVEYQPIELPVSDLSQSIHINDYDLSGGNVIKAFVWNNLSDMIPLVDGEPIQ